VVLRVAPFQVTQELVLKFEPVTVSVNPGELAAVEDGEMLAICGGNALK
jgi:hypothetical protein